MTPERKRLSASLLAFVLVSVFVVQRTVREMNVPGQPHLARYGLQDFRDAIYYPAVSLADGHNPYDVPRHLATYPVTCKFPLYAPHTLLLGLPFAVLPHATAQLVFLGVNLLLLPPLAWLALRAAGRTTSVAACLALATVVLLSHPGEMALFVGQNTVVLVIGAYLALDLARRQPWLAAIGLALATAKPTFGLPIALLMLCRGDRRAVLCGAAIVTAAQVAVLPFLVRAAGGVSPFVASLYGNYQDWGHNRFTSIAESVHRIDAYLLVGRLVGHTLTTAEDLLLTLAIFGVAAAAVRRLGRTDHPEAPRLAAAIVCAATLAGTYHQVYDAVLLVLPALLVTSDRWTTIAPATSAGMRRPLAVLIAVPAFNYFASYGAIARLGLAGPTWLAATTANAAAVLGCFLGLVAIGVRAARARAVVR